MNKQDLVEALSTRLSKSQKEASETIDALVDEIKKALAKGESIRISGFGAFEQTVRGARLGRNPRTGEPVRIGATRVVRFRPAADFKAIVAGTRRAVASAVSGSDDSAEADQSAEAEIQSTPPAKKTTARKAAAKKTTAKKAAAKTAAAKTTAAKKTASRSTTARSTTTAAKRTVKSATSTATTGAAKTTAAAQRTAATAAKKTATAKKATSQRASAVKKAAPKKIAEPAGTEEG